MVKNRIILSFLVFSLVIIGSIAFVQASNYEDTIPPEILRRYDPGIVEGSRPKFVTITQPMIWGLRNNPDQGGEVYRLDLDVAKLSTVQKEILLEWVKGGQKVLIWGSGDFCRYNNLFTGLGKIDYVFGKLQLSNHPVNTDVRDLNFTEKFWNEYKYFVFVHYPPNSEVIVSVKGGLIAGRTPFGRGSIYFASPQSEWSRGADRDRWTLNFYQWLLGLRVPGAAETHVGTGQSTTGTVETEAFDRVLLKNGDTISGKLITEKFTVKTSYALLSFNLNQIESVILEGAGQNIEMIILRNGDKLSGVVGPDTVKIKLAGGQETEIEKDKIKEISVQQ